MEKSILHSIILSVIGTSMIKIAYGINNVVVLIAINVVIMGAALYAYLRLTKKERQLQEAAQKNAAGLIGNLGEKLSVMESHLLESKQQQAAAITAQLETFMGKFVEQMTAVMESLSKLLRASQQASEQLAGQFEQQSGQLDALIKVEQQQGERLYLLVHQVAKHMEENGGLLLQELKDSRAAALNTAAVTQQKIDLLAKAIKVVATENAGLLKETMEQVTIENTSVLKHTIEKESQRNNILLENMIMCNKENTGLLDETINKSIAESKERFSNLQTYKQEVETAIKEVVTGIQSATQKINIAQEALEEHLTNLSDNVQGGLNKINRNIDKLGDNNSQIAESYHKLWKDLSRCLGETANNNQQVLYLLQDHYKALKQVFAEV